ncbi:MAG: hypothetical protein PWP24_991 [Clostridiales bacterium]|nr:hypothetical protein [Clostridiales bacterium]
MREETLDRRVKYTKKMLKEALVELIQNQPIASVTVKALCERADINRSTFYAHYESPYDLLDQIEKEVIENVMSYLEAQKAVGGFSKLKLTSIFEYAKRNAALFEVLLGENSGYALQKDILELSEIVSLQYNIRIDPKVRVYLKEFGTAGCISVFKRWIADGAKETPEEISNLLMQMLQWGTNYFEK